MNPSRLIRFHMQPTDVQNNSSMKSRVQMTRKRHHHLTERMNKDPQIDEKPPDKGQGRLSGHMWSSGLVDMSCNVLFLISQKASHLPGAAVKWQQQEHLIMMGTCLYMPIHLFHHLFSHLWPNHQRVSLNTLYPRIQSPHWRF